MMSRFLGAKKERVFACGLVALISASLYACSPHKAKVPVTERVKASSWDGFHYTYCDLSVSSILDHLPVESNKSPKDIKQLRDRAENFVASHQLQEAIWAYKEIGDSESLETAKKLEEELFKILTTGDFTVQEETRIGGATEKKLLTFENGIVGLFKTERNELWASPEAETATYRVDLAINTNLVPMTVMRKVGDEVGSIQYFMRDVKPATLGEIKKPRFIDMKVLDYFTGNRDRKIDNIILWQDRVVAIDNGSTFRKYQCSDASSIATLLIHRLRSRVTSRIASLRASDMDGIFDDLGFPKEITDLIRDRLLKLQKELHKAQ